MNSFIIFLSYSSYKTIEMKPEILTDKTRNYFTNSDILDTHNLCDINNALCNHQTNLTKTIHLPRRDLFSIFNHDPEVSELRVVAAVF